VDVDVLLRRLLGGAHEHLLAPHLSAQVSRQRDAVVERVALGGDDRDGGVRVGLAKLFGCGLAGNAVAEDDVAAGAQSFSA